MLIYSVYGTRIALIDLRKANLARAATGNDRIRIEGNIESLPLVEGHYSIGLYLETSEYGGDFMDLTSFSVSPRSAMEGFVPYPAQHRGFFDLPYVAAVTADVATK
jgi:hypothetical protein